MYIALYCSHIGKTWLCIYGIEVALGMAHKDWGLGLVVNMVMSKIGSKYIQSHRWHRVVRQGVFDMTLATLDD